MSSILEELVAAGFLLLDEDCYKLLVFCDVDTMGVLYAKGDDPNGSISFFFDSLSAYFFSALELRRSDELFI